jgi:hypothetical protein
VEILDFLQSYTYYRNIPKFLIQYKEPCRAQFLT